MCTRRDLRHDATKIGVQFGLPEHDGGQHLRHAVHLPHNGGGGVVAATFDAEDGKCFGHVSSGCVWLRLR